MLGVAVLGVGIGNLRDTPRQLRGWLQVLAGVACAVLGFWLLLVRPLGA
jgi:hypothetical protein